MRDELSTDLSSLLGRLDPLREDDLARVLQIGRARGGAERIASTPWPRPRTGGRRMSSIAAVVAAACLAAALGIALPSRSGPDAYALSFSERGGYVIARIVDPYARVGELRRELAANRLHVALKLLPVSPGIVGKVSMIDVNGAPSDGIQPLQEGRCANGPCTVGVKVARAFKGSGYVEIGRPARRGERYASTPIEGAFAPGEPLHCSGLRGATVAMAMPVLERRRLNVVGWRIVGRRAARESSVGPMGDSRSPLHAIALADDRVAEVTPVAPGEVELLLVPSRPRSAASLSRPPRTDGHLDDAAGAKLALPPRSVATRDCPAS